ncbi:hypothetical protein [Leyella stercorea]|uniref:hypothetical protein n=1 Tax=Leyella stercorea TaxID=363265 RepID=UPI0024315AED|nr:hypothetical protein [Leyella stercorea]
MEMAADGVGVAAWVWQGCHTLLLIHLRRPMQMSASTDADVCVDRCGCLRRPMRTMQGGLSCSGKRQSRAQPVFLPHY